MEKLNSKINSHLKQTFGDLCNSDRTLHTHPIVVLKTIPYQISAHLLMLDFAVVTVSYADGSRDYVDQLPEFVDIKPLRGI